MFQKYLQLPLFIFALILITYSCGLWGASIPLTGDQKVYLSVALEMTEKKSWIIPYLLGEPNFLKPPLQYWATILSWKVFGLSVFGSLIPSVLALAGSSYFVFKIAERLKLTRPALASFLFASSIGSMTYGTTAQMEIWIVFFMLSSWLSVLNGHILTSYLLVGLMALVKGPLYPVLWTISLLAWNRKLLKAPRFWLSLFVGASLGLSWYFLAAQTHYEEMVRQFFMIENLGKISTPQGSILKLWGEYVSSLFPWVFLLTPAVFQKNTVKKWKKHKRFYLAYSLVGAVFFTFFPYRVGTYLYFLTPVMAMMVSELDFKISVKWKWGLGILYTGTFLLMLILIHQLSSNGWLGQTLAWSFFFGFFLFVFCLMTERPVYFGLSCLILVNLIRVAAVEVGEMDVKALRDFQAVHDEPMGYFMDGQDIWHEYGLISTILSKPVSRIHDLSQLDAFVKSGGAVIFQDGQTAAAGFGYSCTDWQRLKRRTKFPVQRFLKEGIHWGDEEITRNFRICTK